MRVFMDANVLFAAAISPEGRSATLFLLAEHGACILLTSMHAVTEARRNLEARYPDALDRFERLIGIVSVAPEANPSRVAWAHQSRLPDEDAPILTAAVDSHADILVTGDRKHFGHLFGRRLDGVLVLALADALVLLVGRKNRK